MTTTLYDQLERRILLLDGGFGTMVQGYGLQEEDYRGRRFAGWPVQLKGCNDLLALTRPDVVREIHEKYLRAGADIIETDSFNANAVSLADYRLEECAYEISKAAAGIARSAADEFTARNPQKPRFVAGSVGPTNRTASMSADVQNPAAREVTFAQLVEAYTDQVRGLVDGGADILLVETVFDTLNAKAALWAIDTLCERLGRAIPVMVSGTLADASGRTLSGQTVEAFAVSVSHANLLSVGLNCAYGAKQLLPYLERLAAVAGTRISAHPNAGLPNVMGGYDETPEMFAGDVGEYMRRGLVNIVGGCCGTTPAHIAALRAELDALPQRTEAAPAAKLSTGTAPAVEKDDAFLRKLNAGEKVIAIELDSPRVADLSGYLEGARRLQAAGADLLTIADCPIAQARMDSSLVACRVHRELGMCALPHMTCRDRNLNAIKALLLGLYAEGVREVLAITGDPIPTAERDEVKNVYQFNSRKLAQYIVSLAGEGREMPSAMTVLGALNLNARNFEVELRRAVEKLENGMSGFLTQPVLSAQAVENLRKARQTLGERAKILAGIMPVVSQRNAIFMENEINGIHVEEDIIQRFAGLDRERGEALGLEVSMQMAREALPYADGFYLMTPFNRVALMERLIARLKTELLDAEG